MKKQFFAMAFAGLAMAVLAESEDGFNTSWGSGWRLSVGPQFNFNAKGRLGVKPLAMKVPASSYTTKRSGDDVSIGNGRTEFPNGAYIDPSDSAGVVGETWNWHVPAGAMDGGKMSFVSTYSEQSSVYRAFGGSDKDDAWSTGVALGLDRTFWKRGDFGVDLGFNFSFFIKDNWFKGSAGGYTRTDSFSEGSEITDVNLGNAGVFSDPWAQNADGSWGVGTYDGPGPVLSLGDISISRRMGTETSGTSTRSYGPVSIRGDLQMYEFQLALKPYYELTDWFMVRGTLGIGLDYRNLDVMASGLGKSSEHDWDCYMITGLGGMFHWDNVCLGADFLRKVFDNDMDVNTKYVDGSIGNANWMLRVYVGYEF